MAKKKDDPRTAEEIQKEVADLLKKYEKLDDYILKQKSGWDSINATLFKINDNDFFAKIKRSAEQTADISANLERAQIDILDAGRALGSSIGEILNRNQKQYQDISKIFENQVNQLAKINPDMATALGEGLKDKDLTEFFQRFGKGGMDAFGAIVNDQKGYAALKKWLQTDAVKDWQLSIDQVEVLKRSLKEGTEEVFSLRKALVTTGEYLTRDFMPKSVLTKLHDFDQILNDTQKNFGLAMDANSAKFTELIGQNQIFGMGAQENAQFMGSLGESLRTTNFDVLSNAAKDMGVLHKATGLSVDEMQNLGHQLMFYGKSSEQVRKFTEQTMQAAQKYGLNAKKVLQEVTKALPDSRKLGWQGGAKALAEMVMQAQKLGQNIDDLSNSAKKLRTLEGSIEASADLALVGVNTNAIQMLAAARRGGKEFSSFVGDLTKGIGEINSLTGEIEFDPIDIDRLNVIADAIGIPLEKLQDQVAQTEIRTRKSNLLGGIMGNLSPEQKEFLLNATKLGKNNKIEFTSELGNITDASQISGNMIETLMQNRKTLDEQAMQNKSFNDSMKDLKMSIMNVFTYLQPWITAITSVITTFNNWFKKLDEFSKQVIGGLLLFSAIFFSVAKHYLAGYWHGQGFNSAVTKSGWLRGLGDTFKNLFNPMRKAVAAAPNAPVSGPNLPTNYQPPNPTATRNTSSFGEALKNFPKPGQLLALAAAIAAVGVAFIGIGYGIKLASEGLSDLVKSFNNITNAGYALSAISVVMGGFVGMLALMIPIIGVLGATAIAVWPGLLALGAAFVGMGFGIKLATDGISNLVNSFKGLENSSQAMWSIIAVMGSFVAVSALLIPNLIGLGGALATFGSLGMVAVPPLLALGVAAIGIGYGLKIASDGFVNLVKSFDGITNSIPALLSVVTVMGGMTAIMYSLIPALGGLGLALTTFGSLGMVAVLPLLALGAAAVGIGYGISLAINSLSELTKSFDGVSNSVFGLLSITSVIAGMTLSIFALVPAIGTLGTALAAFGSLGMIAVPPLLALGAAAVGIGYGINLAVEGISSLVKAFSQIKDSSSGLKTAGGNMTILSAGIFALAPAFTIFGASMSAFGATGMVAIPTLLAIGVAAVGLGFGIKLATDGFINLAKSFDNVSNKLSIITSFGVLLAGMSLSIYTLIPALSVLSTSLIALGSSGLLAIPTMLALGASAIGVGYGISLVVDSLSGMIERVKEVKNINSVIASLGIVIGGLVVSAFAIGPVLTSLSVGLASISAIGLAAIPTLLSLGAAAVGIGYGISLVINSLTGMLEKVKDVQNINTIISTLGIAIGGLVVTSFALAPALSAIGISLLNIGTIGLTAIPVLLSLGAAAVGIGYGISLIVDSLSGMIERVKEVKNINSVISSISISIGGMILATFALGPALTSLSIGLASIGATGMVAIPTLLSLGAAAVGIGYGINIATKGISELIKTISNTETSTSSLIALGLAMSGISLGAFTLIPAIAALTTSLIPLGSIGLIAIPVILSLGAALVGIGYGINLASKGIAEVIESFKGFKNISSIIGSTSTMIVGLVGSMLLMPPAIMALATSLSILGGLGLVAAPVLLSIGAAAVVFGYGIKLASEGVSFAVKSFGELINLTDKLSTSSSGINSISKSLLLFAPSIVGIGIAGLISSSGIIAFSLALGMLIPVMSMFVPLVNKISDINTNSFKNIGQSLSGLSLGIMSFAGVGILFPLITLASGAISLISASLEYFSQSIGKISNINFEGITSLKTVLSDLVPSLISFSSIGVLSPLIVIGALSLNTIGESLNKISKIEIGNIGNIVSLISDLIPSLSKFSLVGILSAPITLASGAIILFGKAFEIFSDSIAKSSLTNWSSLDTAGKSLNNIIPSLMKFSLLGILSAPITLASIALSLMGKSLLSASSGFKAVANIDWSNIDKMSTSLNNLLPTIVNFGFKGLVAAPGVWLMNSAINSLANTMQRLANPLDIANESLGSMSNNIERLKSAIQGLDTSKLNTLASSSNNFIKSSISSNDAEVKTAESNKPQKITFEPIVIKLELNGRQLQEIVLKDIQYSS